MNRQGGSSPGRSQAARGANPDGYQDMDRELHGGAAVPNLDELAIEILQEQGRPMSLAEVIQALVETRGVPVETAQASLGKSFSRLSRRVELEVTDGTPVESTKGRSNAKVIQQSAKLLVFVGRDSDSEHDLIHDERRVASAGSQAATTKLVDPGSGDNLSRVLTGEIEVFSLSAEEWGTSLNGRKDLQKVAAQASKDGRSDLLALMLASGDSQARRTGIKSFFQSDEGLGKFAEAIDWIHTTGTSDQINTLWTLLAHVIEKPSVPTALLALQAFGAHSKEVDSALLEFLRNQGSEVVIEASQTVDAASKLSVAADLPLGKRWPLVWAAYRVNPDSVRRPNVWPAKGESAIDLVTVANIPGPSRVLIDPWVEINIVSPSLLEALDRVRSRQDLAQVLSWPDQLMAVIPARDMADAILRTAAHDHRLQDAVDAVSRSEERDQLEQEVQTLRTALETCQGQLSAQTQDLESMRAELATAWEAARAVSHQQLAASQGELRQAYIDGLKVFADCLADVFRVVPGALAEAAMSELVNQARSSRIEVFCRPNDVCELDLSRHQVLGEYATQVVVVEPGIEYLEGDSSVLLRKAIVRALKE